MKRFYPSIKTCLLMLAGTLLLTVSTLLALQNQGAEKQEDAQKIHIVAERFNFTPSTIRAQKGVPLEITLTSDDTFHGFRIPEAGLNVTIPARGRGSVVVAFEASEKGRYVFECSRPCGAGHTMMRGEIVVE